jgi:hypothetical protein
MYKTKKKYTSSIPKKKQKNNSHIRKTQKGSGARLKAASGVVGDKMRSIGHAIKNMENPIVFTYQLIEKYVFGWDVVKNEKPPFVPRHKPITAKDFMKGKLPQYDAKLEKDKKEALEKRLKKAEAKGGEEGLKRKLEKIQKQAVDDQITEDYKSTLSPAERLKYELTLKSRRKTPEEMKAELERKIPEQTTQKVMEQRQKDKISGLSNLILQDPTKQYNLAKFGSLQQMPQQKLQSQLQPQRRKENFQSKLADASITW